MNEGPARREPAGRTPPALPNQSARRTLARLDIPTLVERAQDALDAGDAGQAVVLLRTAVRRAPFRQDLRHLLMEAIEAGGAPAAGPRPARSGPVPLPRFSGDRLQEDDDEAFDDPDEEIHIEEVEGEEELDDDEFEVAVEPATVMRRVGTARRTPPRRHGVGRAAAARRRGPASALLITACIVFIVGGAAAGGFGWYYYSEILPARSGGEFEDREPIAAQINQDEVLIEQARVMEAEGRLAEAEEQLMNLSPGLRKDRLLAEFHFAIGDGYTRDREYGSARESYERALRFDGRNPIIALNLGSTYYMLGRNAQAQDPQGAKERFDEARNFLKLALDLDANNLDALERLSEVEFAASQDTIGAEHLYRIIEIDPKSSHARRAQNVLLTKGFVPPAFETFSFFRDFP